jgi:hypothetical protein
MIIITATSTEQNSSFACEVYTLTFTFEASIKFAFGKVRLSSS